MTSGIEKAVRECGEQARAAVHELALASDATINAALREMAQLLNSSAKMVLDANAEDVTTARSNGLADAMIDRLTLDESRLATMSHSLEILAGVAALEREAPVRELNGDLMLIERRLPVGVIGANFEARPNVTLDIASQLIKSQNAGVLRTGSAALGSSIALVDNVIAPALSSVGLPPTAVNLIRSPEREAAQSLVSQPGLIPLVILRGSGESTRALADEGARHGVRTLAHADGGGVLYVDIDADIDVALSLIEASLDRLGVCNRLNLLLVHEQMLPKIQTRLRELLDRLAIAISTDTEPLGHEWALDSGNEATITLCEVSDAVEAATIANEQTSGLAAGIVTANPQIARGFISTYRGTGVFWNAPTRLLDGYKLLELPETGINLDRVPGPRGPVTFQDLYIRQLAVLPKAQL